MALNVDKVRKVKKAGEGEAVAKDSSKRRNLARPFAPKEGNWVTRQVSSRSLSILYS